MESKVVTPARGKETTLQNDKPNVPENPTIPYTEGDGIGVDVTPTMLRVVNTVVEKAYKGEHKIFWTEIYTDKKPTQIYGQDVWLPVEAFDLIREYRVAIKGPLTTPVGGSIRSLDVALRQELDLYICPRPVRYYQGTPSPVKHPELTDMVVSRENSEDVYAGIRWKADSADVERVIKFLREEMGVKKIRLPEHCDIGTRPCSEEGTKRLVRAAIECAIVNDRNSVILVHKGNIIEFTEGAFKDWGYQLARGESSGELIDSGPWLKVKNPNTGKEIVIRDMIADAFPRQILPRSAECNVITYMNLDGNCISDALAVQVGDIGIAPGTNIGGEYALFEATHDTVPKYAGQDKINPDSIVLPAEIMLRHMDRTEVADLIVKGMEGAINAKIVVYDFEHLMEGVKLLKCSESGDVIIKNM